MLIVETERLFLRHFHCADLEAMANVFGDAEVMRFGRGPQSKEWVQEWLRGCLEDYYQKWGFGLWAVVHKPDRRVIGFCGLTRFDDIGGQPEIEIGYRLARAFWGRGLATEAAQAARDYAFDILGLPRLVAIIDPQNTASIHVAQKIGLRYEKDVMFRGKMQRLYSRNRAEIAATSSAAETKRSDYKGESMEKVNLMDKLALFADYWQPKIVGELNGQQVKLVKFQGPFVWHHHDKEDELFFVVKGRFRMEFRERHVWLEEGEFLIVPRGVEHRPVADEETHVLLFEPASTLNTGNVTNERTVERLERL